MVHTRYRLYIYSFIGNSKNKNTKFVQKIHFFCVFSLMFRFGCGFLHSKTKQAVTKLPKNTSFWLILTLKRAKNVHFPTNLTENLPSKNYTEPPVLVKK